ncbi:uncharacterized protein [Argopecten irradians]|uniref:uncharacterized protein n=1 Tax=Argopecten irradians TaxID=31199 RepID=UPI00371EEAB3
MDLPSIYILLVSFGIIQGNPGKIITSSHNPAEGSDSNVLALIHDLEKRVVFLEESRADDAKRMKTMESELDDLKSENNWLRRHLFDQVHSVKKPTVAETLRKVYPFNDLKIDEITQNDIQNHTTVIETGENSGNINRDQKTEKKGNQVSRRSGKVSKFRTRKMSTRVATQEDVSFHANLGIDVPSPAPNRELVYGNVVTNNGDSYSNNTGTFTCKEPGTYVFSWNTVTVYNHFADAHLMKNGVIMASTVSSSAYRRGSSTGVVVLHLDSRDEVWVKIGNRENGATIISWSMFSGFKLNGNN